MYRKGAIGALLDVYEQAISDVIKVIVDIPDPSLLIILDSQTTDENCKSIQTILSHVVHSGYGYATSIANLKGKNKLRPEMKFYTNSNDYIQELINVFTYTENILNEWNDQDIEKFDNENKIKTSWGQYYDIEQLMEHAIVHILRHKRQIVKLKQKNSLEILF